MSLEPYRQFRIDVSKAYVGRTPVRGRVVAVLDLVLPERELHLITPHSRALKKHDIHEVIVVNDANAKPSSVVKGAIYIGFFEVTEGGIILVGDEIFIGGTHVCTVRGFDETHMPNHINIVCYSRKPATGKELGIKVGDEVIIHS